MAGTAALRLAATSFACAPSLRSKGIDGSHGERAALSASAFPTALQRRGRGGSRGGALSCTMVETPVKKSGAELREEFFLAASTGAERGLPEGAFLNDPVTSGPLVDITWEPYGDVCAAPEGSSLLKAAVDAGAMKIDNRFCLTGQCDVCIVEIEETGEVLRSCMKPVPKGVTQMTCLILDTDDAWEEMMV